MSDFLPPVPDYPAEYGRLAAPDDGDAVQRPRHRARRRWPRVLGIVVGALVLVGVVAATLLVLSPPTPETEIEIVSPAYPLPEENSAFQARPSFDYTAHSLTDPESQWVIVNKQNPFDPVDWAPSDLITPDVPYVNPPAMRRPAAIALEQMFADFHAETGLDMQILSSYRSYTAQQQVYGGNDLLTARPGYSEHQTGWVADIDALPRVCSLQACFADTPQGEWLAQNAGEYGFIIRYPNRLTDVTGYQYEPWHFRYVGPELAAEMRSQGISTLEEFFGYPAAPNY